MKRMSVVAAVMVCCVTFTVVFSAVAHAVGPAGGGAFLMPSGNIGCVFLAHAGGSPRAAPFESIQCEIRSGTEPPPAGRPSSCTGRGVRWGKDYGMYTRGRVQIPCTTGRVIYPRARVLAYGARWSKGGVTCWSRRTGLTCKNKSRHGFFMSRQHSYHF
jgi:hypothetical protein